MTCARETDHEFVADNAGVGWWVQVLFVPAPAPKSENSQNQSKHDICEYM